MNKLIAATILTIATAFPALASAHPLPVVERHPCATPHVKIIRFVPSHAAWHRPVDRRVVVIHRDRGYVHEGRWVSANFR